MKASLIWTGIGLVGTCWAALPAAGSEVAPVAIAMSIACTGGVATATQCKMLYVASLEEGGVWGSPEARAASRTTMDEVHCHIDFE